MKIKIRIIIFSFLYTGLCAQSTETTTVNKVTAAVLDFEGAGINKMEAVTLTQRLGSELVKTNVLIMVERNQMNEIMEEQGFQQSGCTSAECAAEIGALLGVQKMITGSFGKIGNTYTIDARMFSVETGQTEKTVTKTYKGEVDDLLTQIEIVAWELVGLEPPDELKKKAGIVTEEPKVVNKSGVKKWLLWGGLLALVGAGTAVAMSADSGDDLGVDDLGEPPVPPDTPRVLFGGGR
jgi:hypothetical protein